MEKIKINEIFQSIQGEGSSSGLPFIFIRLSGCNLRCSYCDTKYAYKAGVFYSTGQILKKIGKFRTKHVLVTGGEPLAQAGTGQLITDLIRNKYMVWVETNGSISLKNFPKKAKYITDIKTPSSGMSHKNQRSIITEIRKTDEIKFVIGTRKDYEFSKDIILKNSLDRKTSVLLSCVYKKLNPSILAKWILDDGLNVRLQLQIHKYIWPLRKKGV